VSIKTKKGKKYKSNDFAQGFSPESFRQRRALKKFRAVASTTLPKSKVEWMLKSVDKPEQLDSIGKFVEHMYP
jgi:hypothetical protein